MHSYVSLPRVLVYLQLRHTHQHSTVFYIIHRSFTSFVLNIKLFFHDEGNNCCFVSCCGNRCRCIRCEPQCYEGRKVRYSIPVIETVFLSSTTCDVVRYQYYRLKKDKQTMIDFSLDDKNHQTT